MPAKKKPERWQRTIHSHLRTDYPKASLCRTCNRGIMIGLLHGYQQMYDPDPISQVGELHALINGLKTYHIEPQYNSFKRRESGHIRQGYPDTGYILRDHWCGHPPGGPLLGDLRSGPAYEIPEECPF